MQKHTRHLILVALLGILALPFSATYATPVTVTADFTQLTMGGFYSGGNTFAHQLSVNGAPIDVCGGDPSCTNALNNPTSITASLSGSSVTFGYDQNLFPTAKMNMFSFTGNTADVAGTGLQNPFTLGSFTFTNGMFYPLMFLDFTLTTHSVDALLDNHTFTGRIRLDTNNPPGVWSGSTDLEKIAAADYYTLQDLPGNALTSLGSVRVYDYNVCLAGDLSAPACNTGSVDLIGHINSLHLDSFANPTGGAFLNSSTTSPLNPSNPVPEPASAVLFISGLVGLFAFAKKRRTSISRSRV